MTATSTPAAVPRGDEDHIYRRHNRNLERAVARAVNAPRELIEDACQSAWTIMLRSQPERAAIFAWLRVVAVHEAYRLSAIERRELHLENAAVEGGWETILVGRVTVDEQLEALEALRALAGLPDGQRRDLSLSVAGFSYREIAAMTGGRTFTNVNKHLVRPAPRSAAPAPHETGAKKGRVNSS